MARVASLIMKSARWGFALELNKTFSINLQLLGGSWNSWIPSRRS